MERHVQPVTEREPHLSLDRDGFFDPREDSGAVPAAELIGSGRSLVLLSPGGTGKTHLLRTMCSRENGTWVDLPLLDRREVREELARAVAAGRPVYLDALDEAARHDPAIFRLLERDLPAGRDVHWRLGCRPEAWIPELSRSAGISEFRLVPLTREAVRDLTGEPFLDALTGAGLGRLSASPLELLHAARLWRETGRMPADRTESLDFEVDSLLKEGDQYRPGPRSSLGERRVVAGRLAAVTMFTGFRSFGFQRSGSGAVLSVDDLPAVAEPGPGNTPVGPERHREVLASPLFAPAASGTVMFGHQHYAEHLAAAYVCDRRIGRSQLADLLGVTGGVVPGTMISVAARVVSRRPDLIDVLLPSNAMALAEADAELSEPARDAVVAALLRLARSGEAEPNWRADLAGLIHSGLESQLRAALTAGLTHSMEVWWVCRLVSAGAYRDLVPQIEGLALDPRWTGYARRAAIAVIEKHGRDEDQRVMRALLDLGADEDPEDELLASALECLYPRHLTTAELLPLLRTPRRSNFIGAYRFFLIEWGSRVPTADLPEALRWAASDAAFDSPSITGIVQRAWEERRNPAVLEALADAIAAGVLDGARYFRRSEAPWASDVEDRRKLADAVAARHGPRQTPLLAQAGLRADVPAVRARPAEPRSVHRLRQAIADAETDLTLWWRIADPVVDGVVVGHLHNCDLTTRPGWLGLTDEERQRALLLGIRYVRHHRPDPADRTTQQDRAGVHLLATVAGHRPGLLDDLPPEVWTSWAGAIVAAWISGGGALIVTLYEQAPAGARDDLVAALLEHLGDADRSGSDMLRSPLYDHLADRLLPTIVERLLAGEYPGSIGPALLDLVVRHRGHRAAGTCRALADGSGSALDEAAGEHLRRLDRAPAIRRLIEEPGSDDAILRETGGLDPAALEDGLLADLALLLLDRFPLADEAEEEIRSVQGMIITELAHRGLITSLERLAAGRADAERQWIGYHLRRARQRVADRAAGRRPSVAGLFALLSRGDMRMVRDGSDALRVIEERLADLQHEITHRGAFRDLWNEKGPKLEDDISDWIQRQLTVRFRDGSIVDREVGVQRIKDSGGGTRIDLTLTVLGHRDRDDPLRLTIEAKRIDNREIPTAMRDQLAGRYLHPTARRHGILLVYWIRPDQRPAGWSRSRYPSVADLTTELRAQAGELAPEYEIRPFVLDVSRPG